MTYRINGFDQIKAFYSAVFEQKYDIKPQHISLYVFLINQNNRNNWVEWFKCPYDLAMAGACIGNKRTYYKCLDDLQDWKFIQYQKGVNNWKAPKIKLEVLKCTATDTATVPQSEPLLPQAVVPTPTQLLPLIYKHITDKQYNQKQLIKIKEIIDLYLKPKEDKKKDFLGSDFLDIWNKWIDYKKELKDSYTTYKGEEGAYNKLIKLAGNNKAMAKRIVNQSIENEWKGLFEFKGTLSEGNLEINIDNYEIPHMDHFGFSIEQLTDRINQGKYKLK